MNDKKVSAKRSPILRASIVRSKEGTIVLKLQSDVFPTEQSMQHPRTRIRWYSDERIEVFHDDRMYYSQGLNLESPGSDVWLLSLTGLRAGVTLTIPSRYAVISAAQARTWLSGFNSAVREVYLSTVCEFDFSSQIEVTVRQALTIGA